MRLAQCRFLIGLWLALAGHGGLPGGSAAAKSTVPSIMADAAARAEHERAIGSAKEQAGAHAAAEHHYLEALHALQASARPDPASLAELRFDLAHCLDAQGRERDAEPLYRAALAAALELFGPRHAITAGYQHGLAWNLERQGDLTEAEPFLRAALDTMTALFGAEDDHALTAAADLARNWMLQGRAADALVRYQDTVARLRRHDGGSLALAWASQGLAITLDRLGRQGEAEPLHREALRIAGARLGPRHPDIASLYQYLAENLAAQGRDAEAASLLRRDLEIMRSHSHARNAPLAASLASLAIHLARDRRTRHEALELAREAASIARSRRSDDHLARAVPRRALQENRARMRTLTAFGKAQPQWRRDAFAALLVATWLRASDEPGHREALLDEGFRAAQELATTASGIAVLAGEARQAVAGGPLADLVREQQRLAQGLAELDRAHLLALAAGDGVAAEARNRESNAIADALLEVERALGARYPAYLELTAPAVVGVAEVQRRLRADEALLLVLPAGQDMFSFAIGRERASWHRLAGGSDRVAQRVARLRCQVDDATCTAGSGPEPRSPYRSIGYPGFDGEAAFGLYDALVAPVSAAIGRAERLYVTVSGPLENLPLGTLLTAPLASGADEADPAVLLGARWLADAHAIVRLPSIAALRAVKDAPRRVRASISFVGYGAPRFAAAEPATAAASADGFAPAAHGLGRDALDQLRTLPPLPGTERELQAMADVLAGSPRSLHLGDAASEALLRTDRVLGDARVVAFATHGLLPHDLSGLEEPALVFTPPDVPGPADDGLLTASEAAQLTLNADWVILSACNTASPVGAQGFVSLSGRARAFLYAGTRALLASHWRVSDDATAALTVETLATAHANPALTRAEAYQRAQRAVRTGTRADGSRVAGWDDSWAHPAAWAPFSLISDRDE